MTLLVIPVLIFAAAAVLYRHLRGQPDRASLWRRALWIGVWVGVARAGLASLGWSVVEHTGGSLQIPAYALSLLALPEAAILGEQGPAGAPPEFYVYLSLLLVMGTLVFVGLVALIVEFGGRR